MSGAEVLRDLRRKWAQYLTLPPMQRGGQGRSMLPTVPGSSTPAVALRETMAFKQDLATYMDLVLEQLERLSRRVEVVEAGPPPVPLVEPHELEELRDEVRRLREQVVALEYAQGQEEEPPPSPWLWGLAAAGALLAAVGAVVSVGAAVWGGVT